MKASDSGRRRFIGALGALTAVGTLPFAAGAHVPVQSVARTRLSRALSQLLPAGDVVEVDSRAARAREMLAPQHIADTDARRKHWFHRSTMDSRARQGIAIHFAPRPIAVNLHDHRSQANAQEPCTLCDDCVSGCRTGARNTLDVNDLPHTQAHGAEIASYIEVNLFERLAAGGGAVPDTARPGTVTPFANLRAADGSIATTSIGVRPLLAIAVLPERATERLH